MSPDISVLLEPEEKIKKPVETADVTVNNDEAPKDVSFQAPKNI